MNDRPGQLPLSTFALLCFFLAVLGTPFLLRSPEASRRSDALSLVIISPHNEAIRYEFARAFSDWHENHHGAPVDVDWRNIGGTSEITRYLSSQFTSAFRAYWQKMGYSWTSEVAVSFSNAKVNPHDESFPEQVRLARQVFLDSDVGVGVDLFFGGGEYDHSRQAAIGHTVPSGYRETPEGREVLESHIPETIAGEKWYDSGDRWYGATLSSFGICYNTDVLAFMSIAEEPARWRDLGNPALFGTVALADPTKSGSIMKAFEMVIQQEMAEAVEDVSSDSPEFPALLGRGWAEGLNVVRRAAANARYVTDAASKVTWDVALGDASVGMCIDFYGQFQAEAVARPDGTSRMQYVSPQGGTTVSCDPIAMLRGAPNRELALRFIVFTLSMEGQKLWGLRAGTPGGPVKYTLHRLPIRRDFYVPEFVPFRSHPNENPYVLAGSFTYRGQWTARLFGITKLLIQSMCLNTGDELRSAWKAIIDCGGPQSCPEAVRFLEALPEIALYDHIDQTNADLKMKADEVRLVRVWGAFFQKQYRLARDAALQAKGS